MDEQIGFIKPRGPIARWKAKRIGIKEAREQQWKAVRAAGGDVACVLEVVATYDTGCIATIQLSTGQYIDSWIPQKGVRPGTIMRINVGNIGPGRWSRQVYYVNDWRTTGLTYRDWPHKLKRRVRKLARAYDGR